MRVNARAGAAGVAVCVAIGASSLVWAVTPSRAARSAAPAATATVLPGDPRAGRLKAESERCVECHGVEGQGVVHPSGPDVAPGSVTSSLAKLAGQRSGYLVKQLLNFQSGARNNDVMKVMSQHLDDADRRDLAAYYATLAPMRSAQAGEGDIDLGRKLYEQGDPARQLVACSACHGPAGDATAMPDPQVPRLAGQDPRYLAQQLVDWRSGWRRNSANGTMNQQARLLSDLDIRALADYLAAPPTTSTHP